MSHPRGMRPPVTGYFAGADAERIAALLAAGGIAVLPTDTVYGFHCAASHVAAVEKIRRLKRKTGRCGFILLASGMKMVDGLVGGWPGSSRTQLSSIWPAPLTAVLPARAKLPPIIAPRGKVAVRVPGNRDLRLLITRLGTPLVSTSINKSGRAPMTRIDEIKRAFPGIGVYISQEGRPAGLPSTVIDFTVHPPRLKRAGRYPWRGLTNAASGVAMGEKEPI